MVVYMRVDPKKNTLFKLITQPKEDRFFRNNSAENYRNEIPKTGKDAAR